MKATIEFNLPDDQESFDGCNRAFRIENAVSDFVSYMRALQDGETKEVSSAECEMPGDLIRELNISMNGLGIEL